MQSSKRKFAPWPWFTLKPRRLLQKTYSGDKFEEN